MHENIRATPPRQLPLVGDGLLCGGRAWLERYDSTFVSSRCFSEFIFESDNGDGDHFNIENTLRWDFNACVTLGMNAE